MNELLHTTRRRLALAAVCLVVSMATTTAGATAITYLASGTIVDKSGPAAGGLSSINVGDAWSFALTIDTAEPDIGGCDPGPGPCDYANGSGTLAIGSSVLLSIGASPGGVVEIWNDLSTIDGVTDGIAFPLPGDGSITPTQIDGLYVAGIGLNLVFNAATLSDASLAGSSLASGAGFSGPQQSLLLFLSSDPDGAGDLALLGAETTSFSVIPVPAAAWLFTSALGLLGWARRRNDGT